MDSFLGRAPELKKINKILELRSASLVVINGRRRIGKSRLIAEFAKPYTFYQFAGLAPREGIQAQDQRNEFMRQFDEQFHIPIAGITDWGALFMLLAKQTQQGRVIILFDEISWMAKGDADFLGKLKTVWDDHLSKNAELILFLCGSVSSWIEDNLLGNTAFLGRPTLHITLKELSLPDCNHFWNNENDFISAYEKLKILSITGGVPRYLELINPKLTAEENIKTLFFDKDSALFNEFKNVFIDIYGKRSETYRAILEQLVNGPATQEKITKALEKSRSGDLSQCLNNLTVGGFVARDNTWQIKTGKVSSLSHYRLSDNYMRFALKYILPNAPMIEKDRFENRSLTALPGWDSIMGLQFENLVLNNTKSLLKKLNIQEQDIIFDNPYFQRKTERTPGCQIDYMIQTRHQTVYICEIKFCREEIGSEIITEMKEKMSRLIVPRNMSKRAVLIHVNGVKESVVDSLFFSNIIDFSEFLREIYP